MNEGLTPPKRSANHFQYRSVLVHLACLVSSMMRPLCSPFEYQEKVRLRECKDEPNSVVCYHDLQGQLKLLSPGFEPRDRDSLGSLAFLP